MLPDFPHFKAEIRAWAVQEFKNAVAIQTPFFSEIKSSGQHEGHRSSYEDEQGNIKKLSYRRLQSQYFIRGDDIPATSFDDIRRRMLKTAEDMAQKKMKMLIEAMNEITESTGNVVDAKGKPLSADAFLDSLDKIEMGFDEDGQPRMPAVLCGTTIAEQMKNALQQIDSDPAVKQRLNDIISRKRESWRDRESRRKLVD